MASDSVRGQIRNLIQRGLDASEGHGIFTSGGGSIEPSVWNRAWGEVFAAMDRQERVQAASLNRSPTADEIIERQTRTSKGLLYRVQVDVQDNRSGVNITIFHSVRSNQVLKYGTALNRALADYEAMQETYDQKVLGGRVAAVYRMTPGR